jgi:maltose alpha-D-glucosyltransferase/alpha-amylase
VRIRRTPAETSNTSIIYGDDLILKLFRRMQPGINPDFEIGRHLTEQVGYTRVPAVTGALEYAGVAEQPTTIGMLQRLVESQADGWEHATDELGRFYDLVQARPLPEDVATGPYGALAAAEVPAAVKDVMSSYLTTAETLGRRTGEMHLALASDASDPAFAPEPFDREDLQSIAADAGLQARSALQALETFLNDERSHTVLPEVAARGRELLARRDTLLERIGSMPALEFATSKIRVHGDYHLGQVLWAEGDFYILDFEGEPARPIAQRRAKQSPLKDVAGMTRSFSYAAHAALFAHTAAQPALYPQLEPWAQIWQTAAAGAFLRGYFATVDRALFIPPETSQRDTLLQLFMLDKALYELNYELNNRPDWMRIPLWGILDLLT